MKPSLATTDNKNAIETGSGAPSGGGLPVSFTTRLQLTVRFELGDKLEQFTLAKNQTVSVGGSHAADVVVPLAALKPQQFVLSTEKGKPAVTALAKEPPLSVNGQIVKQAPLVDGDSIEVGDATFNVSIVGGHSAPAEKANASAQLVGAVATGAIGVSAVTPNSKLPVNFEIKQHANGVYETFVTRDSRTGRGATAS